MTELGLELDSASYPPSVLAGAPVSANRMRARIAQPAGGDAAAAVPAGTDAGRQASPPRLAVTPAGYGVTVRAADRPRNLQELAERVQLADTAPWPAGASIPMGARGKVAHWTGTEWRGGESPGYSAPPVEPPVQLTETPADTAFDTPDVQFPGDGGDSPEELHR